MVGANEMSQTVAKGSKEFTDARQTVWQQLQEEWTQDQLDAMYRVYTTSTGDRLRVFNSSSILEALPRPFSCPSLVFQPFGKKGLEGVIWFCDLIFPALCPCVRPDMTGIFPDHCPGLDELEHREAEIAEKGDLEGRIVRITNVSTGDRFADVRKNLDKNV